MMGGPGELEVTFRTITSVRALSQSFETLGLFASDYTEPGHSPIDEFIANTDRINRIYLHYLEPGSPPIPSELGALVILGYMSAVESYLRALLRGLINIDEHARRLVEGRNVSFGAALHHPSQLLPEALMEDISLAAEDNVRGTFRDLAGVKVHLPPEVRRVLSEYSKICQLRHCCIHRFGKLGTRNAIALGLEAHRESLEKPLKPSIDDLQTIAEILRTFSKTINNYIFSFVLERTARNRNDEGTAKLYSEDWTWDYRSDRRRFRLYYDLFATTLDVLPSPERKRVYDSFRAAFRTRHRT
jgi:hypothetical protein